MKAGLPGKFFNASEDSGFDTKSIIFINQTGNLEKGRKGEREKNRKGLKD
jgi:hypothetical protein